MSSFGRRKYFVYNLYIGVYATIYMFILRYTVDIAVDQWAYCNILGGIGYGSED